LRLRERFFFDLQQQEIEKGDRKSRFFFLKSHIGQGNQNLRAEAYKERKIIERSHGGWLRVFEKKPRRQAPFLFSTKRILGQIKVRSRGDVNKSSRGEGALWDTLPPLPQRIFERKKTAEYFGLGPRLFLRWRTREAIKRRKKHASFFLSFFLFVLAEGTKSF
jgi:hypothetical protein